MKKITLLFLLLCSCSSQLTLTKTLCDSEQSRIDAYYNSRSHGASFGQQFYNDCDSLSGLLSPENQKLLSAYATIRDIRSGDSTDHWSSSFYLHCRELIDVNFSIAKGVAK